MMDYEDERSFEWVNLAHSLMEKIGESSDYVDVLLESFAEHELPYHGLRHCVNVALRAYDATLFYDSNEFTQRILVLAGLFHDAGYPGLKPDSKNIEVAISWWVKTGGEADDEVAKLIRATEYPHKHVEEIGVAGEQRDIDIIRDADILEVGLNPDMGPRLTQETGIKAVSMLDNFVTPWAYDLATGKRELVQLETEDEVDEIEVDEFDATLGNL